MTKRENIAEQVDVLLALYKHNVDFARHQQNLKERTTKLIFMLIGALIGFVLYDKKIDSLDFYATLFISFLGFWGAIWCRKYHERYTWYMQRGSAYRDKLAELFPNLQILKLKEMADQETAGKFKVTNRVKLTNLWVTAHLMMGFFGIWLTIVAFNAQ